jgi:hypothetical protein
MSVADPRKGVHVARDVAEAMQAVGRITSSWRARWPNRPVQPWFRGQANIAWKLQATRFRGEFSKMKWDEEQSMMLDFRRAAMGLPGRTPKNWWEWAMLAQHHGLPTRLLDWTEGALVGLYFAVCEQLDSDAALWVMNPYWLNDEAELGPVAIVPTPEALENDFAKGYVHPYEVGRTPRREQAIGLRPLHVTPRITAQKGTFVMFGSKDDALERLGRSDAKHPGAGLQTVRIPGAHVRSMLAEVEMAGITQSTLFPDLEGLAREIRRSTLLDLRERTGRADGDLP